MSSSTVIVDRGPSSLILINFMCVSCLFPVCKLRESRGLLYRAGYLVGPRDVLVWVLPQTDSETKTCEHQVYLGSEKSTTKGKWNSEGKASPKAGVICKLWVMEINPAGGKPHGARVKPTPQSQPAQGLRQLGVFIHRFPATSG